MGCWSGGRDAGLWDGKGALVWGTGRWSGGRDAGLGDGAGRDAGLGDGTGRWSVGRDAGLGDGTGRWSGGREAGLRDWGLLNGRRGRWERYAPVVQGQQHGGGTLGPVQPAGNRPAARVRRLVKLLPANGPAMSAPNHPGH